MLRMRRVPVKDAVENSVNVLRNSGSKNSSSILETEGISNLTGTVPRYWFTAGLLPCLCAQRRWAMAYTNLFFKYSFSISKWVMKFFPRKSFCRLFLMRSSLECRKVQLIRGDFQCPLIFCHLTGQIQATSTALFPFFKLKHVRLFVKKKLLATHLVIKVLRYKYISCFKSFITCLHRINCCLHLEWTAFSICVIYSGMKYFANFFNIFLFLTMLLYYLGLKVNGGKKVLWFSSVG